MTIQPVMYLDKLTGAAQGAIARADAATQQAYLYLTQLGSVAASLAPPVISPEFPTGATAPAIVVTPAPEFQGVIWEAPAAPAAFTGTLTIDDLMPEPFDTAPPVVNYGTAPAAFTDTLPDAPGVNLTFADPTLSISLPAPPDLLRVSVGNFSGVNLPTFSATEPTLELVAPSIREYVPGTQYTSALLTQLKATLQARIAGGGSGLSQEVENAIWDRGREREARSAREALLELEKMEALGYAFPPGAYLDARIKIATETDYANRGHSREAMIQSAQMAHETVLKALDSAVQLESMLVNYTNSTEQRLFEASKYATEAGVAIYNARVEAYGRMVQVYQTKVSIYQAQIQAEVSKVDAYKAQVQAEQAKSEVNTALVQQYKAQAEIALSNIEIFKAEIAGIQTKAEIEKTKVEVFGEQVRAYTARVGAYTAGVEAYRATLQAEQTKATVFQAQVDAYTARVNAAAKSSDVRIAAYRGLIDAKTAEWDGYKAQVQAEASRAQAIASSNSALAEGYKATVQGEASYNEVLTKQWQAVLDQNQRTSEIAIKAAEANGQLYVSTRSVALDAAKVGAQVSAQLGAAALNAVNFSHSDSNSASNSYSASDSRSQSESQSESQSTSYNYNYSV